MKKSFLFVGISLTVGIMLCVLFFVAIARPSSIDFSQHDMQDFVTPPEINNNELVRGLYDQGYIQNPISYGIFSLVSRFSKKFEAGAYRLSKDMSLIELYQNLASPYQKYVKIQEGFRREQIADQFAKTLSWSEGEKNAFLELSEKSDTDIDEGVYFPDTYLVSLDENPTNVAKVITAKFNSSVQKPYEENKTVVNLNTILTIASMIQREAAGKRDMPIISGIMWNRLFNNWPLQIDATIQYIKGNEKNWWPRITSDDIRTTDSPYNTYLYKGLPPTPISNPGIAAINAALHPTKTSCFFYLHDNWGGFHCSPSYEGHEANIDRFLAGT